MFDVEATDVNQRKNQLKFELDHPFECPHCNKGIEPREIRSVFSSKNSIFYLLISIFQCPVCKSFFFTEFLMNSDRNSSSLLHQYPYPKQQTTFSPEITQLSPQFVKIYNQALQSEAYELDELSGVGYRKALEFLVKDYLISQTADGKEQENIRNELLSASIKRLEDDLRPLAVATSWLGNDPAHYVQKYDDKSLENLKRYLASVIAGISYKLIFQESQAFIDQNKK